MFVITYTKKEGDLYEAFNSVWFDGSLDVYETEAQARIEASERMEKQPSIIAANIVNTEENFSIK